MKNKKWNTSLTRDASRLLSEAGALLSEARRRRRLSVSELAKRAGIDRRTLAQLESGHAGVSMGVFFQVLSLLGLLRGIEEFLKPENDIEASLNELHRIRMKKKAVGEKISDDEVDF